MSACLCLRGWRVACLDLRGLCRRRLRCIAGICFYEGKGVCLLIIMGGVTLCSDVVMF